jgi:hypothetical protein
MADSESGSSGFFKWLGGIVASVVTAVAVYYFTRPAPPPPPPPVVVTVPQTEFDGFVQDATSHTLVSNAKMTFTLGQNSIVQSTDGSGKYSVVMPSPNADASTGQVTIAMAGYQPYDNSVELKPGDNYAVIPLYELPPPPVPAMPKAGATHAGSPGAVAAVPPPPPPAQPIAPAKIEVARQLPPNFIKARTAFMSRHP